MYLRNLTGACLLALAAFGVADSLPGNNYLWGSDRMGKIVARQATTSTTAASTTTSLVPDSACTHGPLTRSCWTGGFSIATDFDQKFPTTGKTKYYSLEITNTTCSPDGHGQQECLLVNGQYPGPVITADWGDMLQITVKNSMQNNGTSIHWHGIRQYHSCGEDGVNGITECALAPGDTRTYTFQATQFGTSWYHSHFSSQYGSGVVGTIVINGPASSNYDVDLGVFPITEWYYATAAQIQEQALINGQVGGGAPPADNILVNGTNGGATGTYQKVTVTPGKKHRLRLINTSVDTFFRVKLDSHAFTVMTADFIPVKPIPGQDWVLIAIGQRYDVVFTADQTAGNYWFRAEIATDCFSNSNGHGRALFTYSGQTVSEPTDNNEVPPTNGCTELNTVPYWKQAVDSSTFTSQVKTLNSAFGPGVTANGQNLVLWSLNVTSMTVFWDKPTLQYVFDGNTSYPASYDVIEIPNEGTWTYWVLQEVSGSPPIPHPIHLHGHDFFVLGHGTGTFDASTSTSSLNFANPPRRDTSTLPGGGWMVIAFPANNPGAWIMHCHIAWHISQGLGVQFLEAKNSIAMPDAGQFNNQCSKWRSYAATSLFPQNDSGV